MQLIHDVTALVRDQDGDEISTRGILHPRIDTTTTSFELMLRSRGRTIAAFDVADPKGRAEVEKLIAGLQRAVAHGQAVQVTGEPAKTD